MFVLAKESATDIGETFEANPILNGATLRVILNGATPSDQTYVLDKLGWRTSQRVFKYLGPTGGDADPVKLVLLKRSASGKALLKALIKGNVGTQSLNVVPPGTGDSGGIILHINPSVLLGKPAATYCVSFGGAAGGTEITDDAERWFVKSPTAENGCPAP